MLGPVRPTLALLVVAVMGCRPETTVVAGEPELQPPPTTLDFGSIQVGVRARMRLRLHNQGLGDLTLQAHLDTPTDELRLERWPERIEGHQAEELVLTYTPAEEGPDAAVLELITDDPDQASVQISISGLGVVSLLEVAPASLWFGDTPPGGSSTQTVTLSSAGSGLVTLGHLVFPADEALVYGWNLPEDVALPIQLAPGHALALEVWCEPEAEVPSGELVLVSDDSERPHQTLRLLGEDGEPLPPEVSLVAPSWGSAWLDSEAVEVQVHAVDPDDPPADLSVLLYLDGGLVHSSTPDAEGLVGWTLAKLDPGEHVLKAQAVDPEGGVGADELIFEVQASDEPLAYVISGSPSVYAYWSVDDDVQIMVDDVVIFTDDSGHQSTHPPLTIEAEVGSVVRVVATDVNPYRKSISDLYLHFGTERRQLLVEAQSASASASDPDHDPDYQGPWPSDFLDEELEVEVP